MAIYQIIFGNATNVTHLAPSVHGKLRMSILILNAKRAPDMSYFFYYGKLFMVNNVAKSLYFRKLHQNIITFSNEPQHEPLLNHSSL